MRVRQRRGGPRCSGKEADDEVGVVYFGERYLIPRIGRWASPDPLAVHAAGGGEALNAYHYVGGNLLQARDPLGLQERPQSGETAGTPAPVTPGLPNAADESGVRRVLPPGTPEPAPSEPVEVVIPPLLVWVAIFWAVLNSPNLDTIGHAGGGQGQTCESGGSGACSAQHSNDPRSPSVRPDIADTFDENGNRIGPGVPREAAPTERA